MELILTRKQLLTHFGISDSTWYRWVKSGKAPQPINGRYWTESQIREWLTRQSTPVSTTSVSNPAKKQRQEDENYQERQRRAKVYLDSLRSEKKK